MRDCEGCIWEDSAPERRLAMTNTPVEEDVAVQMELDRQAFLEFWWEYAWEE